MIERRGKRGMSALVALSALFTALASAPGTALAQDNPTLEAKQSFERGYSLFQQGDFTRAAELFERAYNLRPNYSVLYNLAQAYASSSRFAAAVHAFERYLEEGDTEIPDERRKSVESAIRYYESRVGTLELVVTPAGAEVAVDGRRVGTAPLGSSVRVNAGPHVITATLANHVLDVRTVDVGGGARERVELTLSRESLADFHVTCAVPDVTLRVDGTALPALPTPSLRVLRLPAAAHRFEFTRSGYLPHSVTVAAESGSSVPVPCALMPDPAAFDHATLEVRHPRGTTVRLNGAAFRNGRIPSGRHVIAVTGPGLTPLHTELRLKPRERRVVSLVPEYPRSDRERAAERATNLRHNVAYVLGGAGLVAGAAGAILYLSNDSAHTRWKRDNQAFVTRLNSDPISVTSAEYDALIERENAIRDRDMIAANLAIVGGAALVSALVLRLWPSADKPEPLVSRSARDVSLGVRF